jgi:hypothetical protein
MSCFSPIRPRFRVCAGRLGDETQGDWGLRPRRGCRDGGLPDPEVAEKARRRRFTAKYKLGVLERPTAAGPGRSAPCCALRAYIPSDRIDGETREVGKAMAGIALQVARHRMPFEPPCVLLSGGETTVTLRGQAGGCSGAPGTSAVPDSRGRGGRNVEPD